MAIIYVIDLVWAYDTFSSNSDNPLELYFDLVI